MNYTGVSDPNVNQPISQRISPKQGENNVTNVALYILIILYTTYIPSNSNNSDSARHAHTDTSLRSDLTTTEVSVGDTHSLDHQGPSCKRAQEDQALAAASSCVGESVVSCTAHYRCEHGLQRVQKHTHTTVHKAESHSTRSASKLEWGGIRTVNLHELAADTVGCESRQNLKWHGFPLSAMRSRHCEFDGATWNCVEI